MLFIFTYIYCTYFFRSGYSYSYEYTFIYLVFVWLMFGLIWWRLRVCFRLPVDMGHDLALIMTILNKLQSMGLQPVFYCFSSTLTVGAIVPASIFAIFLWCLVLGVVGQNLEYLNQAEAASDVYMEVGPQGLKSASQQDTIDTAKTVYTTNWFDRMFVKCF